MLRRLAPLCILLPILLSLAGCRPVPIEEPARPALPQIQTPLPPTALPATAVPTQSPAPALMIAPEGVKTETLSTADLQTAPPPGFRALVVIPVGGIEDMSFCESTPPAPTFMEMPAEYQALEKNPLGGKTFLTCGWKDGETVTVTITKPDGTAESFTQTILDGMPVAYTPEMKYGMQLGDYTITLDAPSGKLKAAFKIVYPTAPGMAPTFQDKSNRYFVYGLKPGEHAYILGYRQTTEALRLSAWRETSADARGELLVDDQFNADYLVVAGDQSGALWNYWFIGQMVGETLFFNRAESCPGIPDSEIQPYSLAVVTAGDPNNVRSSPSIHANVIGTLDPGTVVLVQRDQPVCADGLRWWKVAPTAKGALIGWTAEGQGPDTWVGPYLPAQ
jgi:hypothetical protein